MSITEKDRYITINGRGYKIRYSTVSGKCLTKKLMLKKGENIKIDYLFDKQSACIVRVLKL